MKSLFCSSLLLTAAGATLLGACAQNQTPAADAAPQSAAAPAPASAPASDAALPGTPVPVKLAPKGDGFQLLRGGKPYLIKGAGGTGNLKLLAARGGNSVRTWGAEQVEAQLEEAQKLGLTVTAGIWLGHTEHGFNYDDPKQVADQFEKAKATIDKYKNSPALLMWGIGNEMEGYAPTTDPKMWAAVQQIAAYAHKVDPNHPTMTVIAEIGGDKVQSLHKHCPDIDVVGINSYAGGTSIPDRYKKAGGTKPYVLTEFGPPGNWETGKNSWGAAIEPTSSQKAGAYAATWNGAIKDQPLALGGYAFTWGNKQEATATWFGMLLPDGETLGAVDAMSRIWTGRAPTESAPVIDSLALKGQAQVAPGAPVEATLKVSDPDGDPLKVQWILQADALKTGSNGDTEAVPPTFPDAIVQSDAKGAQVKMPQTGGAYRLFAYARDGKGGAAVGNIPLFVKAGAQSAGADAKANAGATGATKAVLPLDVAPENGTAPYDPAGYMGNTGAISIAPSSENPHSGKSSLRVDYKAGDNWGGVVWQNPANDWGDKPGGYNLSGAKKLTFWARGAKGGEVVAFGAGLIGKEKPFPDTAQAKTEVTLTPAWKEYEIDLKGQDLSRIKSGFYWTLAAKGAPVTFYLDDIKYQ